jgi:aldose 1-epimerase
MTISPSGRQVALVFGNQEAAITEVGGGLRAYTVGGRPVIDGFDQADMASGGRGQLLIPWPNRLAKGQYPFGGQIHQVPLNEPQRGNAIHGLVRWDNWVVSQPQSHRAVATYDLHPRPGYPFTLGLEVIYDLSTNGLSVTIIATNLGNQPLPYGAGHHPYLTVGTTLIDDAVLHIPAARFLPTDDAGLPVSSEQPVDRTDHDFNTPRPVGELALDHCFTDLVRDGRGRATIDVTNPADGSALSLWMDAAFKWVMVFTGDTLEPDRRRRSVAIEPMTCPPNAFRLEADMIVLEPGDQHVASWGVASSGMVAPIP